MNRTHKFAMFAALATALWCVSATAQDTVKPDALRLAGVFADHCVLQRELPLPVWGWTEAGAKVDVELAGRTASTIANESGRWQVNFDPFPAGGPYRLKVDQFILIILLILSKNPGSAEDLDASALEVLLNELVVQSANVMIKKPEEERVVVMNLSDRVAAKKRLLPRPPEALWLGWPLTVEVEAKAKELAVARLMADLRANASRRYCVTADQ